MNSGNGTVNYKFEKNRYKVSPSCPCGRSNKDGKFAPFEGFTDKGFCHSCGETFFPNTEKDIVYASKKNTENVPLKFIDVKTMQTSCRHAKLGCLYRFLVTCWDEECVSKVFNEYHVGVSKNRHTAFWMVDKYDRIRKLKVMCYKDDGHRDKNKPPIQPYTNKDGYKGCLFGEHLLKRYPDQTVLLVESEKTALIGRIYYPQYLWLAVGGLSNLSTIQGHVLSGRQVLLLPDSQDRAKSAWEKKMKSFTPHCTIDIVDIAPHVNTGEDIADYLLNQSYGKK